MNLKSLSWIIWPVLVLAGIGLWQAFSGQSASAGRRVYLAHCAGCHMENGQGLAKLIPPLADADYFRALAANDLLCIIRSGQEGAITVNGIVYEGKMPPNRVLTDAEILILVNYMREAWAEPSQALSYETVAAGLQKCPPAREP